MKQSSGDKMKKLSLNFIVKLIARVALSLAIISAASPALSAIPYRNAFEEMQLINDKTKELNLDVLAKMQLIVEQNQFNMANYIPLNLRQNDGGEIVARKILKQTLRFLIDDNAVEKTNVVRKIGKIDSGLNTETANKNYSVSMQLRPLDTTAAVVFKGIVAATVAYDVEDQEAKFEVSKNLAGKTYAYTYRNNSDGGSNSVGVRWSF